MARVRFKDIEDRADWLEVRLRKPEPPAGYTGNTVITEWLTVNCRGDWASKVERQLLRVRFADLADRDRAVARFGGLPSTGG